MDGLSSPAPEPTAAKNAAPEAIAVKKWKFLLLAIAGVFYFFFVVWCLFLLSMLPSAEDLSVLILTGIVGCIVGGLALGLLGVFGFLHIAQSKANARSRQFALIKLIAAVVPGLALAVTTPFIITGEPALSIDIVSPSTSEELVAPLSMSFDASKAVTILAGRDFRVMQYRWDINGDKKVDSETLDPFITATFDRQGIFTVSVLLVGQDGSVRTASRKFVIRQAVFSITPSPPIIDKPAVFSLAHLYSDPKLVTSVSWDFDDDGKADEETTDLQTSFTFLRTGKQTVRATVLLANKTQTTFQRVVDVQEEPPLPFPVEIKSQPAFLISTAPFTALFEAVTNEPVFSVQWDFGDGQKEEGMRVSHTFGQKGTFAVQARVRSQSGVIANVSTVVKIVDRLSLNDLRFEGTPEVRGNRISGEVPLSIGLRAVTQQPFVSFSWEAPDATDVGSVNDRLQAIYRRPGTYTITLVGQDLQNRVLRQPITVDVLPPASQVSIRMSPETGVAPLAVKFDASASSIPDEDITGFIWNFGDGSSTEVGGAVTQHTYKTPGTYVINLTARTSSGRQQSATKTLVVRSASLQPRILASRLTGAVPLAISFDGTSTTGAVNPTYLWDFGDGAQNDGGKVDHVFTEPGIWTVKLIVKDASGKTAETSIDITALPSE